MLKANRIAQAAALIMVVTLAGRFFGFIREMLTARYFPVELVDAYVVAYTLPNIFGVTMTGAFMAAFIPAFTKLLVADERERAWRLGSTVFNVVFIAFTVLVILGMLFAPVVVKLIAPGFSGERLDLTVDLMRIMFPTLIFVSVAGITMGMLNSYDHFLVPALGPLVASISVILAIIFLSPTMGVYALAIGILGGLFLQLAIQVPMLSRYGFRYKMTMDLQDPLVRQVGLLIVPVIIGVGIGQVNILIDRILASGLEAGSIAALNFANQVMQLPMGIFVQAIAVPIFPALSALVARGDFAGMQRAFGRGTNYYTLLLIPMTVGMMVLAVPTIRVIFERGAFTPENTIVTAIALFWYALGILPAAMRDLYTRVFYALQDTKTPVKIGALSVALHIVLNLLLIGPMGHGGLALATSISTAINMIILGWILWKRTGGWNLSGQIVVFAKVALASAVMGIVVYFVNDYLYHAMGYQRGLGEIIQLAGAIGVGFAVYALLVWLMRIEEVNMAIDLAREKVVAVAGKLRS
ncbi:murein biosynthesis integral membrane protein MurJ [Heliorestis acidaminivorans]|uniref:Probable lipid II flippase MurJ n=1 Tax=Heliorestis acidaminivorans TaxID=553427 RepID=A0A6I0F498_9FIRM|nr:murein biosynthesis integral membrane protein MurJ [Heliorestis acidaminivorans]KAB2953652.1 murein biosynthesis integral membrane protein MurJ [Heliorestis acidaminivorans]